MNTRPPKKSPELLYNLVSIIKKGRTIRDACRECGISTTTFNRWRDKDPDFNRDIIIATQRQWENIDETKRVGHRTYKRDARISPNYAQYSVASPSPNKPDTLYGLKIRYGSIYEDDPYTPCINPAGTFVEFLRREKHDIVHYRVRTEAYLKSH